MSYLCCHLIRRPHVAGLVLFNWRRGAGCVFDTWLKSVCIEPTVEPGSSGANGADGPEFLKKFSKGVISTCVFFFLRSKSNHSIWRQSWTLHLEPWSRSGHNCQLNIYSGIQTAVCKVVVLAVGPPTHAVPVASFSYLLLGHHIFHCGPKQQTIQA